MSITLSRDVRDVVVSRPLRIAMVAPPYFTVPPPAYGGVEAVVAGLVDQLVQRGHHVTLLAAGQHGTRAQEFLQTWESPPWQSLGQALPEVVNAARVSCLLRGRTFDVLHDHTLAGALIAPGHRVPMLVTVHGPSDELADFYRPLGRAVSLVAISDAQRRTATDLSWVGTVHNGIDVASFPFARDKDDYVLFLGRYHPHKAPHLAIDAARAAGTRIVLAGKCSEAVEHAYYRSEIAPRLGPDVTDVGVADAATKRRLLARARCLVFPICWDEPFGLVMIEAMACGTPVVALNRGSVPEVVVPGRTGLVVDHPHELAAAIREAGRIDPTQCRRHVEARFSLEAMAASYERIYREVTGLRANRSVKDGAVSVAVGEAAQRES